MYIVHVTLCTMYTNERESGKFMQRFDTRMWGRWALTFIGFPLAGLAAKGVAGPIDSAAAAAIGGLAAGAVLGGVQSFALRASAGWGSSEKPAEMIVALRAPAGHRLAWAGATAIGMSAGLCLGASAVGFATDTGALVAMGALTGAGIGIAQALVMRGSGPRRRRTSRSGRSPRARGSRTTRRPASGP